MQRTDHFRALIRRSAFIAFGVLLSLSTVACGSKSDGGTMCDATPIIASTCATAGCHSPGAMGSAANFDLMTTDFKGLLVGKMPMGGGPTGQMSVCATSGMSYLDAGSNPATGLLLKKLTSSPPCGLQMPMIGMLTSSQKTCFQNWANGLTM